MLKLTITGKDFQLTEGIKDAVRTKAKKISNLAGDNASLVVELSAKGNGKKNYIACFYLHNQRCTVKVSSSSDDMYTSIRNGASLTIQKLNKLKEKAKKANKKETIRIPDASFYDLVDEFFAEECAEDFVIESYDIEPTAMNYREALTRLEKMEDNLYVFYNTENDNKLSVMFKKENGNVGVYEVE